MVSKMEVFSDVIHGQMTFDPIIVEFIKSEEMQRLRNIKQLGMCYYAFPSASHNRFEHALGTAYLAGKMCDWLAEKSPNVNVKDQKNLVQIAALCHDLGHGPFSHTWERFLARVDPDRKWKHEEESVKILDSIWRKLTKKCIENEFSFKFSEENLQTIKNIILGINNLEEIVFQIINNQESGIDVDKWDYLARDSLMLNIPIGFDYQRLMFSSFAFDLDYFCDKSKWMVSDKGVDSVLDMYMARQKLHEFAYQHPTVIILEAMLLDALELANKRLDLSTTPIERLTDHIYYEILYADCKGDSKMEKAQAILRRIESGDLYKCIASSVYVGKPPSELEIIQSLSSIFEVNYYIKDIGFCKTANSISNGYISRVLKSLTSRDCTKQTQEAENYLLSRSKLNRVFLLFKGSCNIIPSTLIDSIQKKLTELCAEENS